MEQPPRDMSISELANILVKWNQELLIESRKQSSKLSTISTIMIIFLVLICLSILITMCGLGDILG